ncbi:hyoscyamine 6-dioxygenase-like [Coffea arabica]|uniref:Hyoscyamine 6-dioxygenase-like n=1 Tax=Coffea arabica TaxID=13443 RepID=A0A6P6XAN3_COFAR|nr:hyoscyamine 6-dioxygenase-like [Coffea arabica]
MASLLSSWSSNLQCLPANYVVPAAKRPGKLAPISMDIPVNDLSDTNRTDLVQKIMKANQEFGIFQVINHGVPENLMTDAKNVGKEFFAIAAEENAKLTTDAAQDTGSGIFSPKEFAYWKDTLQHRCHPLDNFIKSWPDKPARYSYDLTMMIHNYPPCPHPTSALGIRGHYDTVVLTLLQQDVYGLQILKDGQWIGVEPLPNAFVVNIGFSLEVVSNGKLLILKHSSVASMSAFLLKRISIYSLYWKPLNIGGLLGLTTDFAAKSVVSPSNPPMFRGFQYKEYIEILFSKNADMEATLECFKINSQATK